MRGSPAFTLAAFPLLLASVMAVPLPQPDTATGVATGVVVGAGATAVLGGGAAWVLQREDKRRTQLEHKRDRDLLAQREQERIDILMEHTPYAISLRSTTAVESVLSQNPELERCIRPLLDARHVIYKTYYVEAHEWNDIADLCDPDHHHPLLRVKTNYVYLPSLERKEPSQSQSQSQFSLLETAVGRTAHRLLSTAQHSLRPLTNAHFATEMMEKAKPLEQSFVHTVQRAERW
ncbi:MAG: hypothetical protein M1826_005685 [Phylliscum demangeonii]|nr:MAG: hypothetical protein M1826_005685 [Phylliscum demangeonii]